MRPMLFVLFPVLVGCQALAGCQSARAPAPVKLALPAGYSENVRGGSGSEVSRAGERWWQAFEDSTIDRLAADGLAGNLDILQARARLAQADANITVAGAGGLPSLTLGLSHVATRETGELKTVDGTVKTSSAAASASWLLDLFGESRSQTASARALRNAALAGTDVARLSVLSGVVSAYIDARYYQERMRIARLTLEVRRRTLAITREMQLEGTASDLDISLLEDQLQSVTSELPGYEANFLKSAHRIATLTGRPAPALVALLEAKGAQPAPVWRGDTGVPADLTRNRPDVRQAESELASAMADIGVAQAQLFPSITLSGSITPSYISSPLKSGGLTTWSFGPSIRLPILDGGRLRANLRVAVAKAREKQAAWTSAVLVAVEEVENALVAFNRDQKTVAAQETRIHSAARAVELSKLAYDANLSSRTDVIDAEKALYDARAGLAVARRDLALHFVALKVAAGYGLAGPGRAEIITGAIPAGCAAKGPSGQGKARDTSKATPSREPTCGPRT